MDWACLDRLFLWVYLRTGIPRGLYYLNEMVYVLISRVIYRDKTSINCYGWTLKLVHYVSHEESVIDKSHDVSNKKCKHDDITVLVTLTAYAFCIPKRWIRNIRKPYELNSLPTNVIPVYNLRGWKGIHRGLTVATVGVIWENSAMNSDWNTFTYYKHREGLFLHDRTQIPRTL